MNSKILLTTETVGEWREERNRLRHEAKQLFERIDELERKLSAAEVLLEDVETAGPDEDEITTPDENLRELASLISMLQPASAPTLIQAIKIVLEQASRPLNHKQIRELVPETGYDRDKLLSSPNYYYTAINRLLERGEIVRDEENKTFSLPKTETADDTRVENGSSAASQDHRPDQRWSTQATPAYPGSGGGT